MLVLDAISRILHVSTAIAVVGGSVFTLLVLMPAARQISADAHRQLAAAVQSRWKWFVHLGILLFLLSGFYNYLRAIPNHDGDGLYHGLVGTKILLALVVFFIAAALAGRSEKLQAMRDNRGRWLALLVLLAAIIVAISGFVKVRGTLPVDPSARSAQSAS